MSGDYSTVGKVITIYNRTVFVVTSDNTLFYTVVHIYAFTNNCIRSNHRFVLQCIIIDAYEFEWRLRCIVLNGKYILFNSYTYIIYIYII
jgi:hypothetical protein